MFLVGVAIEIRDDFINFFERQKPSLPIVGVDLQ